MKNLILAAFAAMTILIGGGAAVARNVDEDKAVIEMLLGETPVTAESFTPGFLEAVPLEKVREVLKAASEQIGPVVSIKALDEVYRVTTATHEMDVLLTRDAKGRISGLLLHPPVALNKSLAELADELGALPGEVAYLVTRNGEVLASRDADKPLAVGSAFKLGILAALDDRIAAGKAHWSDTVELEARQVSLPSGILQTFAVGSPLTLSTLATLMISISDNTATDVLLDYVGREAVAAKLGTEFVLKTREVFLLKGNKALRERFLGADLAGKRALADEMDGQTVRMADVEMNPHDQGIEWYVPLERLCALASTVKGLDAMRANPGLASKRDWAQVSYKGGSEVGVLNMTTAALAKDGDLYCAAFTWNGEDALKEADAAAPYGAILGLLARE